MKTKIIGELSKDAKNASSANLTAVEWLFNQIKKDIIGIEYDYADELKQAKEMEKQQIKDAFYDGKNLYNNWEDGSNQYYNETYGGNNGKN